MDLAIEKRSTEALRAYVSGDSSEPIVISAFHDVAPEDRSLLVTRHRRELAAIDPGRLVILESMLLKLDQRHG